MGISEATFYRWKQLYGGVMASGVEKMGPARGGENGLGRGGGGAPPRQENAAGGDLPQTMTPARGREIIDFVRASFQVSIRRACRTVPACRATYHYRSALWEH